jgi:hypothetical protein
VYVSILAMASTAVPAMCVRFQKGNRRDEGYATANAFQHLVAKALDDV